MSTPVTSVLAIIQNPILLEGIISLIEPEPDIFLASTTTHLDEGLALAPQAHVACVLIDLDFNTGFEAILRIRASLPTAVIIGLITYELDDRVPEALASGASAVLGKDQISQTLIEMLRHEIHRKAP